MNADLPAIFSLHMSNSVDPIREVIVNICNEVIWMLNMISGAITFQLKGVSFNIFTQPLILIEVLGLNSLLSLTVLHFEE